MAKFLPGQSCLGMVVGICCVAAVTGLVVPSLGELEPSFALPERLEDAHQRTEQLDQSSGFPEQLTLRDQRSQDPSIAAIRSSVGYPLKIQRDRANFARSEASKNCIFSNGLFGTTVTVTISGPKETTTSYIYLPIVVTSTVPTTSFSTVTVVSSVTSTSTLVSTTTVTSVSTSTLTSTVFTPSPVFSCTNTVTSISTTTSVSTSTTTSTAISCTALIIFTSTGISTTTETSTTTSTISPSTIVTSCSNTKRVTVSVVRNLDFLPIQPTLSVQDLARMGETALHPS